jgi:hypothetical protein
VVIRWINLYLAGYFIYFEYAHVSYDLWWVAADLAHIGGSKLMGFRDAVQYLRTIPP